MTDPQPQPLDYNSELAKLRATAPLPTTAGLSVPWTPADYAPFVTGPAAKKLVSSAVAPLVALARGYETVDQGNHKDFAARHGLGDGRSKRGSQFRSLFLEDNNVLYMPWNSVTRIKQSREQLTAETSHFVQLRPDRPRIVEDKPLKYEFLTGTGTTIDFHPATTNAWVEPVTTYLIAEGMLKGDSALTAMLRKFHSDVALSIGALDSSREQAMNRLALLMEAIPHEDRVAIINIAGVGNWKNNPEWSALRFKDSRVVVAFDGDVASNWNVWTQANQLFEFIENQKGGEPVLLDLAYAAGGEEAMERDSKIGIDDYLATVGTWDDLISAEREDFPDPPNRKDSSSDGDFQVRNNGTTVDQYQQDKDPNNNPLPSGRWITKSRLGGRITFFETRRTPTDAENAGKGFGEGFNEADAPSFCAVEVGWRDEATGAITRVEVTGPNTLLNYPPAEWVKHGASLPNDLLAHPEWPPADGRNWLVAVKGNDADQTQKRTRWTTMGWVPAPNSRSQAFIAGNTIIATDDDVRDNTLIGVDENTLGDAGRYGVHDVFTGKGFTDPSGKYDLRDDIRTVVDAWVTRTPWLTQNIAVTMLGLAIRPAVPLQTSVASYLVGPPQKGKSWSAKQIMTFWQHTRGAWARLPGNADDTFASTENAVASTMLWVADDLAPSTDRRKADQMEANISGLIRQVFNGLGKRRMNQDMSSKTVLKPRALFIVTAENENSTQSIRERSVIVEFKGLNSDTMAEAERLGSEETTASRITAAFIRWFIARGEEAGWEEMVEDLRADRNESIDKTKGILQEFGIKVGDVTRPAEIVGDLSLGLIYFAQFCEELGLTDIAEQINWGKGGWLHLLAEQVSFAHRDKAEAAPGAVLLDAVRALLSSGQAHIANADDPARPPIVEGDDQQRENVMLGWQADSQGELTPKGPRIGYMSKKKDRVTGERLPVIYLASEDSFNESQRRYSKRIPHGASSQTYWKNVWDLNLVHPLFKGKRPDKGVQVQYRISQGMRPYGIPVSLESLYPDAAIPGSEDDED